jgi:hypothetical protein
MLSPGLWPMGRAMQYLGTFSGDKSVGTWSWSLTQGWCRGQEDVDVYTYSPYAFMVYCSSLAKQEDKKYR